MYMRIYVYVYMCIYVYVCVYIYTHIYYLTNNFIYDILVLKMEIPQVMQGNIY